MGSSSPRAVFLAPVFVPPSPVLQQVVYYEDDLCVVIYDGFPKAQYHLLLLAKASKGSDLASPPPGCRPSSVREPVNLGVCFFWLFLLLRSLGWGTGSCR